MDLNNFMYKLPSIKIKGFNNTKPLKISFMKLYNNNIPHIFFKYVATDLDVRLATIRPGMLLDYLLSPNI